ncbi:hypothetical protein G9A89_011659 [Geosiphon pyriformis]|nr:hypothetical protein G9A89_011659 [Geosiphon pyriformis]
MSSGVVYYKFKSQKDHAVCNFDGTGISVFDLKKEIIVGQKLGKGTDFDLALYNPQTDEEYTDDNYIIPRSASVIVRRLPASKPGKGTAQKYVNGYMPNTRNRVNGPPIAHGKMSVTFGGKNGPISKPEQTIPKSMPEQPKTTSIASAHGDDDSEEAKIRAMFQQTSEQWAQQQEKMAEATPIYNSNHRRRPQNHPHHQQNTPQRIPPANYVCFRCGNRGHYINNCPTNGDKEYDKQPRIKRTTGIPRSFLKEVNEPKKDGPGGLMVTPQGGLVVAIADEASWEKHKAFTRSTLGNGDVYEQVPVNKPELECRLCHHLFREAVTIPCCRVSYCDDCIRNYLLEHDFSCPNCHETNQTPDNLIRSHSLRKEVDFYLRDYTIKLKSNSQEPSATSTPQTPPKIEDNEDNENTHQGHRRGSLTSSLVSSSDNGEKSDVPSFKVQSIASSSNSNTNDGKNMITDNKVVHDGENVAKKREQPPNQQSRTHNINGSSDIKDTDINANNNKSSDGNYNQGNNNIRKDYAGLHADQQYPTMLPNNSAYQEEYWEGATPHANYMMMEPPHRRQPINPNMMMNGVSLSGNFYSGVGGLGNEYFDESMDYIAPDVPENMYASYGHGQPLFTPPMQYPYNRMAPYPNALGIPASFPSMEQQYHNPHALDMSGPMMNMMYNQPDAGMVGEAGRKPYNEKKMYSQMKRPLDVVDVHAATHQAKQKRSSKFLSVDLHIVYNNLLYQKNAKIINFQAYIWSLVSAFGAHQQSYFSTGYDGFSRFAKLYGIRNFKDPSIRTVTIEPEIEDLIDSVKDSIKKGLVVILFYPTFRLAILMTIKKLAIWLKLHCYKLVHSKFHSGLFRISEDKPARKKSLGCFKLS